MTINRNDINTSADGAEIFIVDDTNSPFTNTGDLTTSGDFSIDIHAIANGVTVVNRGNLTTEGLGSLGIAAFDPVNFFVNNVTILNYGTISTHAIGNNESFADGIDVFGDGNKVVNYGSINVADPYASAIYSIGTGCSIINNGALDGTGNGILIDGGDGTGNGNTVVNYGRILTTADLQPDSRSHGIWIATEYNVIKNYGFIEADGYNGFGISMEAANNHAKNYGTILVTGEIARGVLMHGEGSSFDNYGLVRATGEGSLGVRFSDEVPAETDGGVFTNYGRVEGAGRSVSGTFSDDHVTNRGALIGDVSLGAGADSYVAGKGGSLTGMLRLGDGDDLITFEKGGGKLTVSDFVAGAGTDDAIDVSAFGFHSFAEVMSHASQAGSDVILKLGAKDQIVLQSVTLAQLHPDDFDLGGSEAHSQLLAHHDPFALI